MLLTEKLKGVVEDRPRFKQEAHISNITRFPLDNIFIIC